MDVDVSTSVAGNKPQRIRRIQTVTLVLLFMAGIVNFLDRSSLSVAGEAIRGELGLSATEFGATITGIRQRTLPVQTRLSPQHMMMFAFPKTMFP